MRKVKSHKLQLISKSILLVVCLFLLGACATVHPNPKLEEEISLSEVSRKKLNPPDRSDETFFLVTLSGGGTRAAALAYGVMEALNKVEIPISFAVTASSSFPGAFNGVSLHNYGGTCGNEADPWVHAAIEKNDPLDSSYRLARRELAYRDSERKKYVHLYDGGVSDNLGLRSPFNAIVQLGREKKLEEYGLSNTKKVVFIIVNAQISKSKDNVILSHLPDTPRTGRSLGAAMTTIMNSGNFDTLFLFKEYLMRAKERGTATKVYPIHLAFENLEDPEERQFFENVSTALALPEETVDRLIEVAGRLLYKNKEFQRLVKDMDGTIPDKQTMTGKTD